VTLGAHMRFALKAVAEGRLHEARIRLRKVIVEEATGHGSGALLPLRRLLRAAPIWFAQGLTGGPTTGCLRRPLLTSLCMARPNARKLHWDTSGHQN
jgi:hypothetical protein